MVDRLLDQANNGTISSFIEETVTPFITRIFVLVLSFVAVYVGAIILFFILKIIIKLMRKIKLIKYLDNLLGGAYGFVRAILLISIILLILSLVLNIQSVNDAIGEFVRTDMQLGEDNFRLSKYLYDNNWLKFIINLFV